VLRLIGGQLKDSVMMANTHRTYIPAAGRHWLLPLYDVMTKLIGADQPRRALLDQADLRPGDRVLDVGCGTGSLDILLKRLFPAVDVIGVDPDPEALARARRKAERADVSLQFDQGFADALKYPADTFNHVFSSYMFHHLQKSEKEKTLREIYRVLKPAGYLHLLDFEGPESNVGSPLPCLLHSHHLLKDNSEGRIVRLMTEAGFADVKNAGHRAVLFGFGRVAYYQGSVPTLTANVAADERNPQIRL